MVDRGEFQAFFGWEGPPGASLSFSYTFDADGYSVARATVSGEVEIPAYALLPPDDAVGAAVVIHQHGGERHFGKSEVAGLIGSPLLAWGPMLAKRGLVVLAPDMIGFEDRRSSGGTDPRPDDADRHYAEMTARLVGGQMLMSDGVRDVGACATAISDRWPEVPIGVAGHSFGGTAALFSAALDERLEWLVSSGAAGTIRSRIGPSSGLEFSLVMPGFLERWDMADVLGLVAPRRVLVMSADEDPYSRDADRVVEEARPAWGYEPDLLAHIRYEGGHALTADRVDDAMDWISWAVSPRS